jgi:hypothetical protein
MRYCPMNCIHQGYSSVFIDKDECVECGVCLHVGVCPVDAIYMPPESLEYPRAIRMQFSDPSAEHPNLKAWGRGTEEAKTNDVTGKFAKGEYGMLFEFGRPVTGTRFTEVQKITTAVCEMGLEILEDNPIYGLLEDKKTGSIKREYLNEKILSAILEIKFEKKRLEEIVMAIFPLFDELDTVVSVGLVSRFSDEGILPVIRQLENLGISVRPNAKINVGLGRPIVN